jgi:PAS domain S-box-containing protein
MQTITNYSEELPQWVLNKWQELADLLASMLEIPAALIMKTEDEYMEVFITSHSDNNPYHVGDKEKWYGLYCETVIKSQKKLLLPNALKEKNWDRNPDIELGMIAYLGFPLNAPNNKPFGTICILDTKENEFSENAEKLMLQFKKIIELDMVLLDELKGTYSKFKNTIDIQKEKISSQKELIKERELRYKTLSDLTFEGILIHDRGIAVDVNKSFLSLFGYTEDEVIGRDLIDLVVGGEESKKVVREHISNEKESSYEVVCKHKDGHRFPVIIKAQNIILQNRKLRVTSFRDMTEVMRSRERELAVERKSIVERLTMVSSNILLYEYDVYSGKLIYSDSVRSVYGLTKDQVPTSMEEVISLIYEPDRNETVELWKQVVATPNANWAHEYRIKKGDGTIIWIRDRALIKRDSRQKMISAYGSVVDITKEKQTEENLIKTQKWLNIVMDNIQSIAFIKNIEGEYLLVNKEFERLVNKTSDEIIGFKDDALFPKETARMLQKNDRMIINNKKPVSIEETAAIYTGETKTYLSNKVPLLNEDGNVYALCGFGTDVTDLKDYRDKQQELIEELSDANKMLHRQKEQLEKAQQQLIQSEKMVSIGILSAGVAHEINNPVNYISSGMVGLKKCYGKLLNHLSDLSSFEAEDLQNTYPDYLEKHQQKIDENIQCSNRMFKSIQEGVGRTVEIIESMRVFSRSSDDHFDNLSVHEVIDHVLVMLKNTYKNRIVVEKSYCKDATIKGISGKLHQVFMNVISNAIDSIPENGTIKIVTSWNKKKDTFSTKIVDTGEGMSDDQMEHIFDPFFTTKEVGKGSGLGLYITYNIVKQHHGTIKVSSQKDMGSEFTITLPKNYES